MVLTSCSTVESVTSEQSIWNSAQDFCSLQAVADADKHVAQLCDQLEVKEEEAVVLEAKLEEAIVDGNAAKGKLKGERESSALLEAARAAAVKVHCACKPERGASIPRGLHSEPSKYNPSPFIISNFNIIDSLLVYRTPGHCLHPRGSSSTH